MESALDGNFLNLFRRLFQHDCVVERLFALRIRRIQVFLCDRQNMSSVWWSWIQNETESRVENVIRGRGINSLSFYSQPSWFRTRCWRDSARKWLDCCCQLLAHISRSCSHWDRRDMCEYHQIRQRIFSSYLPSIALYAEHLDTHSAKEVMVAGGNF